MPAGYHGDPVGNGSTSPLRRLLLDTAEELGCSMNALTVLATQNDPFRQDTPANHRDGHWLAANIDELGIGGRRIHLRGLHYALLGQIKPNGKAYVSTDADWTWLQGSAGKAARWLGYVPFDAIVDERNAEPVVDIYTEPLTPWANLDPGTGASPIHGGVIAHELHLGDPTPTPHLEGFHGQQPYRLVIFGEKSSLEEELAPLARRYRADLFLATGEISDTLLYQMAAAGAADPRPMIVLTFCDCDPGGWQMPISIARKLQAFRASLFPDLHFEVHRAGLTPGHVRAHGLPSSPLKDTERRAGRWVDLMGVEQTEIDSLATLRPNVLRQIARDYIEQFYDVTLASRVSSARAAWLQEAKAVIDERMFAREVIDLRLRAGDLVDEVNRQTAERLAEINEQAGEKIAEINTLIRMLQTEIAEIEPPDIPAIPEPELDDNRPSPLVDSRWPFAEQVRALKASKSYEANGRPE